MIEIIRIYVNKGGATDVCIKDPNTIYETLKVLETDIDLDYLDKGNRSVMKFLVDKTVKMVELPDPWVNLANFNTKDKFELALQKLEN